LADATDSIFPAPTGTTFAPITLCRAQIPAEKLHYFAANQRPIPGTTLISTSRASGGHSDVYG